MSAGLIPASLACAALGLGLGAETRRDTILAVALAVVVAGGAWTIAPAFAPGSALAMLCWLEVGLTAALVILQSPRRGVGGLALAAAAGLAAGLAAGPGLIGALAWLGLALPARAFSTPGRRIALRVAASWLVTIAALNIALPLTTPTPGYARDHLD